MRLSSETGAKQALAHADLTPDDYLRIQRMLDEAEAIQQGDRHLVFQVEEQGRWWRAVVKANRPGDELYLQSYHRIMPRHAATARARGTIVRRTE